MAVLETGAPRPRQRPKALGAQAANRPERPHTAAEFAYREIKARILRSELEPGKRLTLKELQQALGVSPIPIREAMQLLSAEGLLSMQPHRGAVVTASTNDLRDELFFIRIILEAPAALVAARRITPQTLDQLRALNRAMKAAAIRSDADGYAALNEEFHKTFYAATGMHHLEKLIDSVRGRAKSFRFIYLASDKHRRASIRQHASLIRAIEARDGAAICALIIADLSRWLEAFQQGVTSEGSASENDARMTAWLRDWQEAVEIISRLLLSGRS